MNQEMQTGPVKKCPKCHEEVLKSAENCEHCGSDSRSWLIRHKIISAIGVFVFVFIFLASVSSHGPQPQDSQKSSNSSAPIQKSDDSQPSSQNSDTVSNPSVTSASPAPQLDKDQIVSILKASSRYYSELFDNGKAILGTKQYTDENAGLEAMNDPSSAAVRFGAFRTSNCIKNDPGSNATNAYKEISDLYSAANITPSDALDSWNSDLNNAASDICLWAGDGISWQIGEIPTAKLKDDEDIIAKDFIKVKADMDQLVK
jgi:predicted 3-demethylubiquinone-9 3-methyltransferase (glyoxalase superfamily)